MRVSQFACTGFSSSYPYKSVVPTANQVEARVHPQNRTLLVHRACLVPLFLVLCSLWASPSQAQTFGCTPAMVNDIVCENSKTGNPDSDWSISGVGDSTIQGFATDISVNQGATISFKVKT